MLFGDIPNSNTLQFTGMRCAVRIKNVSNSILYGVSQKYFMETFIFYVES